ncbi:DEAD/DEAH box helicase [Candidatus Bathyarchaeota archaeon]|nr:DEAD/DEAH box helicase [Candidatus Bathyarchaeota archaeon]
MNTIQEFLNLCLLKAGILNNLSEIQKLAIPHILKGENTLLIAPTGTGKTYAAVLPVFSLFLSIKACKKLKGISILYITPLRALNRDILRRIASLGEKLGINVQVRHGDTPNKVRVLQVKTPPDMLITTPETLQAILPGKKMREHLKGVKWIIIDEIHELACDKRGVQLSIALERLTKLIGVEPQRIGLSATVGDEEKIANFLVGVNRRVKIIKASTFKGFNINIEYVTPSIEEEKKEKETGFSSNVIARIKYICELVSNHNSTLIFTNTREHAEALGAQIKALNPYIPVEVHHGSLSREVREEVESKFQSGEIKAVVCTSSLELGIDVGTVDLVIQYMSPRQAVNLIQRVGRSGHSIEAEPKGVIITNGIDDFLESIVITEFARKGKLEEIKLHENSLDVLAHQIVGLTLDFKELPLKEIYEVIKKAYTYRNLTFEDFLEVIKQLNELRILKITKDNTIKLRFKRAFKYYYENLSMIPEVKHFSVFDFTRRRKIGVLDQEFVAKRCFPGLEFIMHGYTWKVIKIDEEKLSIDVEPAPPSFQAIPSWEGELIPVEFMVANEVGKLREELIKLKENEYPKFLTQKTNIETLKKISEALRFSTKSCPIPTNKKIVIERFENAIIIHSCFGNLVNETLAMALLTILNSKYNVNISFQIDPYRIGFVFPFKPNPKIIVEALKSLNSDNLIDVINAYLEESELFAWRHWHVAKRFGALEKNANFNRSKAKILIKVFHSTPINKEAKREIFLEKFDIENTKKVLANLEKGEITIEVVEDKDSCSILAYPMLDKIVPREILKPILPEKPLTEVVKERILSKTVKLICLFNGDWSCIKTVQNIPEKIKCPKCGSTLIAVSNVKEDLERIIKKKLKGQVLNNEEKEAWKEAWKTASLIQNYGKKAVIALSGHGVGPATAVRILRKPLKTEEDLYNELIKAEREYVRTRIFWN